MIRARRAGLALLALCAGACGSAPEPPPLVADRPIVERINETSVRLRWNAVPEGAALPVHLGASPDAIDRSGAVAVMNGPEVTITGLAPEQRPFFELVRPGAPPRIVAERLLPLEGAHNFRDLGGYETSDGRFVRWGRLFRSDELSQLTDADVAYVARLGIRWLCDFRSDEERAESPDRLPAESPPTVERLVITDGDWSAAELRRRILAGEVDDLDAAELMKAANRGFATTFRDRYTVLLDRLARPDTLPALIHCTGGKDRAGFGAAVVLLALGVPRETVMYDYLLTNHYTHARIERMLFVIRFASLFRTDPERVRPLMGVDRDYLQAAFEVIDRDFGSDEAFLRDGLGLSEVERNALRGALLR